MSNDHGNERSEDGQREQLGDRLQSLAEVLTRVILASRMANGVTVSLSVKGPEGEPMLVSQSATLGGSQSEQAIYAMQHLRHLRASTEEAIRQVQGAAEEELEARKQEPS